MDNKKFYDIHMHAMDMSHPNLIAFLQHRELPWYFPLVPVILKLFPNIFKKYSKKILNLLTFMEYDILDSFLLLEYFLKNKDPMVGQDNSFQVGSQRYNKIVLTPLMMDFGYKNIETNTFYNLPPKKPITKQVKDIFTSINRYCSNELVAGKKNNRLEYKKLALDSKRNRLFEIYPFLGLNTKNYGYDELKALLEKYFASFTLEDPLERQKKLFEKMGCFQGDLDDPEFDYNYMFAGIKVYPPLGFCPWPDQEADKTEFEKVNYLYHFCQQKNIPITTHCSEGGFCVDDQGYRYVSPLSWEMVIRRYPRLKINFAHFGKKEKKFFLFNDHSWQKDLIRKINNHNNLFVDFACLANKKKYYKKLGQLILHDPAGGRLKQRILFGTDFMINLIWSGSYNEYIRFFSESGDIKLHQQALCSANAEQFLYGWPV